MKKYYIYFLMLSLITVGCNNQNKEVEVDSAEVVEITEPVAMETSFDNLKLRTEPSKDATVVAMLPYGTPVTFFGEKSDDKTKVTELGVVLEDHWYAVTTASGEKGWILGTFLYNPATAPKVEGKFPEASQRILEGNKVDNMDYADLKAIENEIYARHGFIFPKGSEAEAYYTKQAWYRPNNTNIENDLSQIEKYNLVQIESGMELQAELESDYLEYGENLDPGVY